MIIIIILKQLFKNVLISYMDNIFIQFIILLIEFIDSFRDESTKLIKTFDINDIDVLTDTGYKPISSIHMTKRFEIYKIVTSSGKVLECADTHIVFDDDMNQVYVKDLFVGSKIQTKDGVEYIISIERKHTVVNMCDITVDDNNHRFYSNDILSHNTTTSAIFLLWYVLFNFDKNALVLGNKGKTAKEILDKIKKIFYELPYYLRPGVQKWNEMEIVFDNGCRIMAETTTTRSGISFTYHCVLADEFAHIAPNILDEFYENLFPTITAGKARFIISSTQNGFNLFQRLWAGAVAQDNEYAPFETKWHEVPEWNPDTKSWEPRDEAWHRRQIANYGSEEAFNKQFGTAFDSNANALISNKKLKDISNYAIQFERKDLPGVEQYFVWHPDYNPITDLRKDKIIITCDLAEGGGHDYTTFIFNKVINDNGLVKYKTLGMFHQNEISLEKCAQILRDICNKYMDIYRYYISIEMNTYGELFVRYLKDLIDKDPDPDNFNYDVFLKFKKERYVGGKTKTEYKIGVKLDSKEKLFGCMNFKSLVENNRLENFNLQYINELYNFCDAEGNNVYKASYGHDDIVMAQMQISFFERSSIYNDFIEDTSEQNNDKYNYNIYDELDNYRYNDLERYGEGIFNDDEYWQFKYLNDSPHNRRLF